MPGRAQSRGRRQYSEADRRRSHSRSHAARGRSHSVDIADRPVNDASRRHDTADRRANDTSRHRRTSVERGQAWRSERTRNRASFAALRTGRNERYRTGDDEEELVDSPDWQGLRFSYARPSQRRRTRRAERSEQRRRLREDVDPPSDDDDDDEDLENACFIGNASDDSQSALFSEATRTPAFKRPPRKPKPPVASGPETVRLVKRERGHHRSSRSESHGRDAHAKQARSRPRGYSGGSESAGLTHLPQRHSHRHSDRSQSRGTDRLPLNAETLAMLSARTATNDRSSRRDRRQRQQSLSYASRDLGRRQTSGRADGDRSCRVSTSNGKDRGDAHGLYDLRGGATKESSRHGPRYGRLDRPSTAEEYSHGEDEKGVGTHTEGQQRRRGCCCGLCARIGRWSTRRKVLAALAIIAMLLIIIIPAAVVTHRKGGSKTVAAQSDHGDSDDSSYAEDSPYNKGLKDLDHNDIPTSARGTFIDPFTWYDTRDFNLTFTNETVGGLALMGLNSTWDDSARANRHVPALNASWDYGETPIRGVSLGGWLSIEPFITPSLFEPYDNKVVDEWTLVKQLGSKAKDTIEKHYATFVQESTFAEIQDAGFDHVRIPFSYWAVRTYDGDEYLPHVSWRYLLRGIEWARRYGLRVLLDLHGIPGSQNGWNHSGRQGTVGWLNGTHAQRNAKRGIDVHDQLSQFFAQDRYHNVIGIYGLVNEPLMINLNVTDVIQWNTDVVKRVRGNGLKQWIAVGDGFLKLTKWKTMMQDVDDQIMLDTHQYTIFNLGQIGMSHAAKLEQVCSDDSGGWIDMLRTSNTRGKGFGPTICGEWSQADTDCAEYINGVGIGSRWTGTLNGQINAADGTVLTPQCPTAKDKKRDDSGCTCDPANADPSKYSDDYKTFLKTYAEAQMYAFEQTYGWFYWTWDTEKATQWSYKKARDAGIMPRKAYAPSFKCGDKMPDLSDLPDTY